ncbi:A circularly permuted ATPgrasp family protein [Mycobacterium ulcerans str. Harvey]|uniref:A circularly permuted ATPgrasp family protein n=1 Tax=Mycobacterium ulcerans str. Harvey TaxID=1299332 RepID=A0ABP3AB78_MYCUL|nr:A circularly permuted ATPgrasp family protein [Mycobacterium ulcerans str. Harvey]
MDRAFLDQGITFSLSGQERPFPLDLVPRVISAAEWSRLERGIIQRVKALEMYLDDIYGDQEILRDGVIPRRLITSCEHFHREAMGIITPNGVRIHVAGIDLIRNECGDFRVLEDNLRSPSGCPTSSRTGAPWRGSSRTCSPPIGSVRSTTTLRTCCGRSATRRPPTRPTPPWWC